MSILIELLGKSDFANSVVATTQEWVDAPTDLDKAAVAAKFAAVLASGAVIGGTALTAGAARSAMQSLRLGLAVSGRIDQMDKIAAFLGVVEGYGVGEFIDAVNEMHLGSQAYDLLHPSEGTSTFFTAAQKFRLVFDPLTLDLDGDGLETVGIDSNAPILFDHDADGIKTGTGWVKPDDGMLVLDRNGNGSIDTGRELFGDSTLKSNGQLATDGFDALADLDSNGDGKISSADAQFAGLRVWRDLNQDGISQSGELFTLDSLGIASISTAQTANSQTLPNENQIADLGQYTRTDGSIGVTGEVSGSQSDMSGRVAAQQRGTHRPAPCGCNLAADTFHREFTDTLDTSAVSALFDMQACPERSRRGRSMIRDLCEAANYVEWKMAA